MELFFELLRVSVGNLRELSRIPSAEEWKNLYRMSKEQAIQGVVYDGVSRLPKEQQPDDLLMLRWYGVAEKIRCRNKEMNRACEAMSYVLHKDGKQHVILKGQGVANLYPVPQLRVPGDIDVWMEGSRQDIIDYFIKLTKIVSLSDHDIGVDLKDGTRVEAHFIPGYLYSYIGHHRLMRYFQSVKRNEFENFVTLDGVSSSVPISTNGFNRIFVLVHIFNHFLALGIGLRQLMDYYYVLKQGFSEVERKTTLAILKSLGMIKFTSAVMYVLQEVLGLEDENLLVPINVKEGKFLLKGIMLGGNFGSYDKQLSHGHLNLFQRVLRLFKYNVRLLTHYPKFVLFVPLYKINKYITLFPYRKYKGYSKR